MPEPVLEETVVEVPGAQAIFLGGIFVILGLVALRAASAIFIPLVVAIVLKFVLQSPLRLLKRMRIPQRLSAFLVIVMLLGGVGALISMLAGPASDWAEQVSTSMPELKGKFLFLSKPVEKTQQMLAQAEEITKSADNTQARAVTIQGTRLSDKVFLQTRDFFGAVLTTVSLLFFLLASGDTFLRRLVEVLPTFRNKRQIVDITQQVEADISAYLLTITAMNALVGIATGVIMWGCGIANPILWAVVAFLLNYVPFVGPMIACALFAAVALMEIPNVWQALLPASLYLCAHVVESACVTPQLLARKFTINPVIVILALVFWYWMWGLAGAILAVPMLAIVKIICDRVENLKPIGHFLEG